MEKKKKVMFCIKPDYQGYLLCRCGNLYQYCKCGRVIRSDVQVGLENDRTRMQSLRLIYYRYEPFIRTWLIRYVV